jgi:phage terminase large subunit-like protein
MEGYSYFFRYEETKPHPSRNFTGIPCALGADLSRGDDFCAFTFMFPMAYGFVGVKALSFISQRTYEALSPTMRDKYNQFIAEGTLVVMNGTVLDIPPVYTIVDKYINDNNFDVRAMGYDPYNADAFVQNYVIDYGPYGVTKVPQGARTESVPLGEIKALAEDRSLIFDEEIMKYCMGNCIVIEDNNGNRKLLKSRKDKKIDNVAALIDAYVAYKEHPDLFD